MRFILGGRCQGKTEYAVSLCRGNAKILDLAEKGACLAKAAEYDIIKNLHEWVRRMLEQGKAPSLILEENLGMLRNRIVIGDEIGSGIVPIDPFERLWRDETGRVYQLLTRNADVVDRVFAGIGITIKGKP